MDRNIVNKMYKKKLQKEMESMTVKEIFDLTPRNETILREEAACAMKDPDKLVWKYPWLTRQQCHEKIHISKFLNRFLVCYKIEQRNMSRSLSYLDVSFSPSYPGLIQYYLLDENIFRNFTMFTAFVHSEDSSDFYDSAFSVVNAINFKDTPLINIIYSMVSSRRLPPPYDTQCQRYSDPDTAAEYNLNLLNNLTIAEMGHVHTLGHVYGELDYPIITPQKLKNITFHDKFAKLKHSIFKTKILNCALIYNVPQAITDQGTNISVSVNWPQDSMIEIKFVPDQDSIDFIVYILSSIGIWFGMSVFTAISMVEKSIISRFSATPEVERVERIKSTTYFIIRDCDHVLRTQVHYLNSKFNRMQRSIRLENRTRKKE